MDFSTFKKTINEQMVHSLDTGEAFSFSVEEPVYLFKTSGSTSPKSYLHKLSGIKAAVESFLKTFPLESSDKWGLCLSVKHVAGFSILARSYFGGLKEPHVFEWSVKNLVNEIKQNDVSILSLIPTQVFDIVSLGVKSPKNLKHVFVGGSFISLDLIERAKALGWPLVMCYGSTETFAQMSYSLDGLNLTAFEGWEVKLNEEDDILVLGPSLYWASLDGKELKLRDEGDFFNTKDLGVLNDKMNGKSFSLLGKSNGLIKIKGSYFDFNKFKRNFNEDLNLMGLDSQKYFPVVLSEERNGAGVYLICTEKFNDEVLKKHSNFRGAFKVNKDIFSSIGKIDRLKLECELLRPVLSV